MGIPERLGKTGGCLSVSKYGRRPARAGQLSEFVSRSPREQGWDGNVECSAYRTNSHTNRSLTLHRGIRVTPARHRTQHGTQSACHPVSDSNRVSLTMSYGISLTMSYGIANPCSRAVPPFSLAPYRTPSLQPLCGRIRVAASPVLRACSRRSCTLSGWAGCARGERNDNIRTRTERGPATATHVVLHNDAICLTREQRLSGDKLNGAHGLIHGGVST